MFVLKFFAVSLELRHELGAGVSIIAIQQLPAACSKPREAQLEAGRHTAAHLPWAWRRVRVLTQGTASHAG